MEFIKSNKKTIAIAIALIAVLGGFALMHYYGLTRSTENAYINADVVSVAAQVSGRVTAVQVVDNQHVLKGDPLFDIDPEPFKIALLRAEADLALARQNARQDNAEVSVARAQIAQIESDLGNARASYERDKELVESISFRSSRSMMRRPGHSPCRPRWTRRAPSWPRRSPRRRSLKSAEMC